MIGDLDIVPRSDRRVLIGWTVNVGGRLVDVDLAELPAPGYPTVHQVRHVARAKLSGLPGDKVAFAQAMDSAYGLAIEEWEHTEEIRKHCVKLTGITWRKASAIDNSSEYDSIRGIDSAARSAAYELPQLGWNPEECNSSKLWEILKQRPAPRPKRTDPTIRDTAIDMRQRSQVAPNDFVPF